MPVGTEETLTVPAMQLAPSRNPPWQSVRGTGARRLGGKGQGAGLVGSMARGRLSLAVLPLQR